jgi:CPA1 family monovalent cation:H+ antiporter
MSGKILEGREMFLYEEIGLFILSIAGALLLGALTGWIGAWLMRRWKALKDHFVGTLLPILIVYLTFCIAQAMLEISGVIAVMATTLVFRVLYRRFKEEDLPTQAEMDSHKGTWEILGELANAVLFFILGVEIGSHTGDITWILMPGVIAALLITRSVVVYGFGFAFRIFRIRLPWSWQHTLNLGGLKGALSVALILMIPKEYPYRDYFLFAALAMVLFTLIGNTLAMRLYLAKVKIDSSE